MIHLHTALEYLRAITALYADKKCVLLLQNVVSYYSMCCR